jgi:hypothetical protein
VKQLVGQLVLVVVVVFRLVNYIYFTSILSNEVVYWSVGELTLCCRGPLLSHCLYWQWYFGLLNFFSLQF